MRPAYCTVRTALLLCVLAGALPAAASGCLPGVSPPCAPPRPNILLVLADDLETDYKQDRLALMPNLRERLVNVGTSFRNAVASTPVCGPSRASLLSGRYAHNHKYLDNLDVPSLLAWLAEQDGNVGAWLTAAGYFSSYHGKYVNGLEAFWPHGWRFWGGFSSAQGTYNYYNSTPYAITFDASGRTPVSPVTSTPMTGVHQADFLGQAALAQMSAAVAAGQPFFTMVNPTMVHYGTCYGPFLNFSEYTAQDPFWEIDLALGNGCTNASANQGCSIEVSPCPSLRHAHSDGVDGLVNPHVPSWDAAASGGVPDGMAHPPGTAFEHERQDVGFRNRTASARDLDDMLGVLLDGLAALGVSNSTLVIFARWV